nr:peritrophin-1-like [Procambarus clarkii]
MIKHSLLTVTLAVVCAVGTLQQDSCLPDCTGKNPLDKVPDPLNCTNYYICINDGTPADHALACPSDNFFDPEELDCFPAPPEGCQAACPSPGCLVTCNGSYSMISDAFNCSTYYVCIEGVPDIEFTCPSEDPYFDGVSCVSDKDACCKVSCVPYCQTGVVQALDPTDCTKCYLCPQEGPVDPSLHFTCDIEEHFDYQSGQCVAGSSCTSLC